MIRTQTFRLFAVWCLLVLWVGLAPAIRAADADDKQKKHPPNRLAQESSPYLLQHAHNPVHWYPWGPEAFAKAKKEGKLVFLSIGYSSCFWCHVMERESFSDEEMAKFLNEHFVCIKVDREERPDIDQIYMTALNVLGQQGGWPLSMFLTADGKPIVGGTYWPLKDREIDGQKVHGFQSITKIVYDLYQDKPKEVRQQADRLADAANDALSRTLRGIALVPLDRALVDEAVDDLRGRFDPDHGGFGSKARQFKGAKFPTPPYLQLLQHEAARTQSKELAHMVTTTLDRMAQGGIHDHLGGGFHRYSTERTWTVPHFEKMLYDNAQLVEIYAEAYRQTKKPLYQQVVRETLAFVERELTSPEGGFYSALDAETDAEEGRFYVWTDSELKDALNQDELALVRKVYGVEKGVNFEGKYHILTTPKSLADVAQDMNLKEEELRSRVTDVRRKLFLARAKRERPFLDTKILTAWNGQMIAGYAVAGQVLNEPNYLNAARRGADFILKKLRTEDGRLSRSYSARPGQKPEARLNGYLDDYAFLIQGLLCLHDATREPRWLDEAKTLTDVMVKHFHDDKQGGFYYTAHDHEELFARAKDQYDGAQPAGNSVAARNLVRLWRKTGDDQYRALAEKTFKTFTATMKLSPISLTTMADALALYLEEQK
ncbi:MAG: thioredoxin domain-containing protein [Gemmataceae bacterium]